MLYDAAAGLYLTKTRAYNPKTGRFLQLDILDEKGRDGVYAGFPFGQAAIGTNLNAWCKNNPVNMVDPSGLSPYDWMYKYDRSTPTSGIANRHLLDINGDGRGAGVGYESRYEIQLRSGPTSQAQLRSTAGGYPGSGGSGQPSRPVVVQHKTVVVAPRASAFEWTHAWRNWGLNPRPSGWATPSIADYTLTGGVLGGVDVDGGDRGGRSCLSCHFQAP